MFTMKVQKMSKNVGHFAKNSLTRNICIFYCNFKPQLFIVCCRCVVQLGGLVQGYPLLVQLRLRSFLFTDGWWQVEVSTIYSSVNVRTIKRTVINNPNIYLCRVRSLGYSHQVILGWKTNQVKYKQTKVNKLTAISNLNTNSIFFPFLYFKW